MSKWKVNKVNSEALVNVRHRMKGVLMIGAVLFCVGAMKIAAAAVDDPILRALINKGIMTEEEAIQVEKEAKAAQAAHVESARKAERETLVKDVTANVADNIRKALPRVSGRIQPQYVYRPTRDNIEGTNNFNVRRARIKLTGGAGEGLLKLGYNMQFAADNGNSSPSMLEAEVMYLGLSDSLGEVRFGKTIPPVFFHGAGGLMLTTREFADSLFPPGDVVRQQGIVWYKGNPLSPTRGLLEDKVHIGLGIFNSPGGGASNNVDNDLLFAGMLSFAPNGKMTGDEINWTFSPFKYHFGMHYAFGKSEGSEHATNGSRQIIPGFGLQGNVASSQTFDESWGGLFVEAESNGWYGKARWGEVRSDHLKGPQPLDTFGMPTDEMVTRAWTVAVSKAFSLANDRAWALAVAYEEADNEHPGLAGAMVESQARNNRNLLAADRAKMWHLAATYRFNKSLKVQAHYRHFDGRVRGAELEALAPGGTTKPQDYFGTLMTFNF